MAPRGGLGEPVPHCRVSHCGRALCPLCALCRSSGSRQQCGVPLGFALLFAWNKQWKDRCCKLRNRSRGSAEIRAIREFSRVVHNCQSNISETRLAERVLLIPHLERTKGAALGQLCRDSELSAAECKLHSCAAGSAPCRPRSRSHPTPAALIFDTFLYADSAFILAKPPMPAQSPPRDTTASGVRPEGLCMGMRGPGPRAAFPAQWRHRSEMQGVVPGSGWCRNLPWAAEGSHGDSGIQTVLLSSVPGLCVVGNTERRTTENIILGWGGGTADGKCV